MSKCLLIVLMIGAGAACAFAHETEPLEKSTSMKTYPLWDPAAPAPDPAAAPFPRILTHVTVHRAKAGDYTFLHGPAIYPFHGQLFASWANSLVDENSESETCRSRRSHDGGLTWGPIEIIAPGFPGEERHSHGAFFLWEGRLYAPAARFGDGPPIEHGFSGLRSELFVWEESTQTWSCRGTWIPDFWPMETPKQMPNGLWIQGGFDAHSQPVVAVSVTGNPAGAWKTSRLMHPAGLRLAYAETTVLVYEDELAAVIRPPAPEVALVATSRDWGATWSPILPSNLPMATSKPLSGKLSTGQHFLVYNSNQPAAHTEDWSQDRDWLLIAVSRPGARHFAKLYRIRYGTAPTMRFPGRYKSGSWAYPNACEHDSKLYVVYSVNKEDCELSIIPVDCLSASDE